MSWYSAWAATSEPFRAAAESRALFSTGLHASMGINRVNGKALFTFAPFEVAFCDRGIAGLSMNGAGEFVQYELIGNRLAADIADIVLRWARHSHHRTRILDSWARHFMVTCHFPSGSNTQRVIIVSLACSPAISA